VTRCRRSRSLLTDAKGFPRWNSTVSAVEGQIREGERLRLRVPGGFAPIFKGVRTFVLRPRNDGSTDFAMEERFSGLMLPLVQRLDARLRPGVRALRQ
jgi:hypothetical protein